MTRASIIAPVGPGLHLAARDLTPIHVAACNYVQIDAKKLYTPAEAATLLGVKEATIKEYCRVGRTGDVVVEARKVGPRHEWRIRGASIIRIREEWGLET